MAIDVTALTAAIADEETKESALVVALEEIVKELQAMRNQAGGAMQPQIDGLTQRIQALSTSIASSTADAVAAEDTGGAAGPVGPVGG